MEGLLKLILIVGLTIETYLCFNVDTKFPIVFNGQKNSYFGFTGELLRNDQGEWALISAPKGNISLSTSHEPGVLYKCDITRGTCRQVILDVLYNEEKLNLRNFSYKELKDDMMMGVSLNIQAGDGNIVTCGHLWKNAFYRDLYLTNGVCYYFKNNFSVDFDQKRVKKLLPLIEHSKQIPQDKIFNLYAYGLAGFSATFISNSKEFILGAPGVYEGKGSLIYYDIRNSIPSSFPIIPQPELLEDLENDSYVGYSVTSGRFFHDSEISIATGAPRSESGYGCVYIFQSINRNNPDFVIEKKIIGHKLIEYFGAVVLGVNINNDQYTDLVVGAPFYSTLHGGDEGKVYVYISDGKDLHEQKEALKGSNKPNARFGTSVSNCGDLNKDGFIDIAIGAPYEDERGAVYIYHGSENGVKSEFIQRIAAKDFNIHLSGFGIAISEGKDIDFNAYPDILIGSYDSDNAVLLRSHPVITIDSKLEFSIKHISINSDNKCKIKFEEMSCFNVKYCAKYVGYEIPKELAMKTILEVDVTKIYAPRAYFIENENQTQKLESQITLQENTEFCETQTVYLMNDIQDFISPIKFQLTYNLKESPSSQFCKNCPVIDATKPKFTTKEIMFWIGCGEDNECQSDLKISVKSLSKIDPFIIGESLLEMEIKAENLGEPAYNSTVFIQIPENIIIINQAECTSSEENSENYTLLCNVGNPLIYNNPKTFHLKLDTSNLSAPIEELVFKFWIETASEEIFPSNNFYSIKIPVIFKPDIQIRGLANNEIIYIQEDTKELIPIIHTYFISKRLKNPIALVDITLSIPSKSSDNGPLFLELSSIQIDNGTNNVPASCDISRESFINPIRNPRIQKYRSIKPYTHEEHADHSNFDTINLDCSNTVCKFIKCKAGPFMDTKKFAKLQINAYVNLTNLQNSIGKKDVTVIVSEGTVLIQDENHDGKSAKGDYATTGTSLEKHGLHQPKKIGIWIIIICIIAGILLLTLLILVLIKVGFFRRKEQEEMEKLKKDDDEETLALNDNPR